MGTPFARVERIKTMSAVETKHHLQLLQTERALALSTSLAHDPAYMADLDEEILVTRHAYIGSAVMEIATLRAELTGPLQG